LQEKSSKENLLNDEKKEFPNSREISLGLDETEEIKVELKK